MTGALPGRGQAGLVDVEAVAAIAVAPVVDVLGHPHRATARGWPGVTRHQRPQVGAVGSVGIGNAVLRTSASAAAMTPAARLPAMPSPISPTQPTTATASPSQPAQFEGAEPDEEAGRDQLPDDVLEGQLAGDPGADEAEHAEGLPADGAVGQRHRDGAERVTTKKAYGTPPSSSDRAGLRGPTLVGGCPARLPWPGEGARL